MRCYLCSRALKLEWNAQYCSLCYVNHFSIVMSLLLSESNSDFHMSIWTFGWQNPSGV